MTGVEMFRKLLDQGQAGDTRVCCCAAPSVTKWTRPGAVQVGFITPHTKFEAEVRAVEGRRPSHAVLQGYRPQFYFRTMTRTGAVTLPDGTEMVMPGDNVKMTVQLINPVAMDEGLRLRSARGGRVGRRRGGQDPQATDAFPRSRLGIGLVQNEQAERPLPSVESALFGNSEPTSIRQ